MDKEREPPQPQLDVGGDPNGFDMWDELFEPLWATIVHSFKKHCHLISDDDAQDMAADTILLLVRYFDHHTLIGLGEEDCRRRLWGYIKHIQPGVIAAYFKKRALETELLSDNIAPRIEVPVSAPPTPNKIVRDAMHQMSAEDRELIYLRVINGWTFPQIQEEVKNKWTCASSLGALRMRFPRALAELKQLILERLE